MIHKQGKLRADKQAYPDGMGCCIWYPFPMSKKNDTKEDAGVCFDFAYDDIDDMIKLLKKLKKQTTSTQQNGEGDG